ncbi:TRAP transporter substrate-binding protein [Acuticoccus sediminis]|nr:TRAP transporter substrate-binding protein [Acuticoccus sediminis]
MVTTWPKNYPGLGTGAQRTADRISRLTDGRITVKLFAAGELVPAFEAFDAVSNGTAEIYHAADYYFQGKHPSFSFFTTVPLGLLASEMKAWVMHGGGWELWNELSNQFGVKPFPCGNTGTQMGGWFRGEVNTLDDLKGLKFRMPGLGGEALRQLGVNVVALPGGEIFQALQTGAIDGAEWVGPWNDLAFGFYRIAKNYYYPGFNDPGAQVSCGVNMAAYNELSDQDKAAIEAACLAEDNYGYAEFMAKNGQALTTLVTQHGVQLKEFPDEIFAAFAEASDKVVDATGNYDALAKKVLESYRKARTEYGDWTRVSDQAYANARQRAYGG